MKKGILKKSLLLGVLPLMAAACSESSTMREPLDENAAQPGMLGLTVSAPSKGSVLVRSIPAEPDEAKINSLNVFVFRLADGGTDTDETQYTHALTKHFEASELTDGANGTHIAWIPLKGGSAETGDAYDISGKKVRLVITANDATATTPETTTTLADFRKALATAEVTDGNAADRLVDDQAFTGDSKKSFPMSAVVTSATKGGTDNSITVNAKGINVEATLVRTMARIDIFNYTPNLTIESVSVRNANDRSCVLPSADLTSNPVNVPDGCNAITVNQIAEYTAWLAGDGKSHAYKQPDVMNPTAEDAKKVNTRRALYLYEQAVTDEASSPVVAVKYTLKYGETESYGVVEVPFRTADEAGNDKFVNVLRNHVYTIRIGDGSEVNTSSIIASSITVDDFTYRSADDVTTVVDGHEKPTD